MSTKPVLSITTPKTACFPSDVPRSASELRSAISLPSAISSATPLSAISRTSAFRDPLLSSGLPSAGIRSAGPFSASLRLEELQKTPIEPPLAYRDFLTLVSPSLASPPQTGKSKALINRTSTASSLLSNSSSGSTDSEDSEKEKSEQLDSGPSTARTDITSECDGVEVKKERSPRPSPIDVGRTATPRSACPMSAPPAGTMFPSMKIPPSPAVSTAGIYSPMSPLKSPMKSPLSAASIRSPFDWDAALKLRRAEASGSKRPAEPETPTINAHSNTSTMPVHSHQKRDSRSSIRHIREVVTRTVTYTPRAGPARVGPAPKGKRRKLDTEAAAKS